MDRLRTGCDYALYNVRFADRLRTGYSILKYFEIRGPDVDRFRSV